MFQHIHDLGTKKLFLTFVYDEHMKFPEFLNGPENGDFKKKYVDF